MPTFRPSASAVRVNILWFTSLVFSLIAASLSILVKQWLREYLAGRCSNPEEFIRIRHCRRENLQKWHVFRIVAVLPVLLNIALILFFIGLGDFLLSLDTLVGVLVTTLISCWLLLYSSCIIIPMLSTTCPYITPLSKPAIRSIRRSVWHFYKRLHLFFWDSKSPQPYTGPHLGKYYEFPGDEKGIRRDIDIDLHAFIKLDYLLMDDAIVERDTRVCLQRLRGEDILGFIQHFLQHRRAIQNAAPSADTSPLVHTDFTRISTCALVATIGILCDKLETEVTSPAPQVARWAFVSVEYIFKAIHHSYEVSRALGSSTAAKTSNLLVILFKCGQPEVVTQTLIYLSQSYLVMEHLDLQHMALERE